MNKKDLYEEYCNTFPIMPGYREVKYTEPCVTTRFCFHSCKYLSITESEQNRLKVKDPHFCERYNKQVKHNGMHPRLPMLNECDYDNSEPRENRYELPPLQFL